MLVFGVYLHTVTQTKGLHHALLVDLKVERYHALNSSTKV